MRSVVNAENRTRDFPVHETANALFCVIWGRFDPETEKGRTRAEAGEFVIVPKGVKHRPVVKGLRRFLMSESEGTVNKENSCGFYRD